MDRDADAREARAVVKLSDFENGWYRPGSSIVARVAWMVVSRVAFDTSVPWPYSVKRWILRRFGCNVGAGVVLKPRIRIKYPWNVAIGTHAWIGEGVWIDSLARVTIGASACLSQGVMVETGNHDWSKPAFDLIVREVVVEDGAWAAVKSLLLPGSRLASHAILGAGSVLSGDTDPYGVYVGVPALKVKERKIEAAG